jgi:hypothetical protein
MGFGGIFRKAEACPATRRWSRLLDSIMDELRKMPSPVDAAHPIAAKEARQGEIILRRPWERALFIAGLAAAVLLGSAALFWR